jgi:hypothetical protein
MGVGLGDVINLEPTIGQESARAPFLPSHPSRATGRRREKALAEPVNACDFGDYCLDMNFLHRVE